MPLKDDTMFILGFVVFISVNDIFTVLKVEQKTVLTIYITVFHSTLDLFMRTFIVTTTMSEL